MIRVSVIYEKKGKSTFNYDYYVKTHMPLAGKHLHPVKMEVDKVSGAPDGSPPSIHCVGYLYFANIDAFRKALATGAGPVMADISNYYSGGQPTVLVSEVVDIPVKA